MTSSADRYLTIYLQDHLLGSTGGINLTKRARAVHATRDPELHRFLAGFQAELEDEREVLLEMLDLLGAAADPVKTVAATVGERLARLKLNGHLRSRSPYSDLVELESLSIAVQGKRAGWIALRERAHPRFAAFDLDALIRQAEAQSNGLESLRRPRAAAILAGEDPARWTCDVGVRAQVGRPPTRPTRTPGRAGAECDARFLAGLARCRGRTHVVLRSAQVGPAATTIREARPRRGDRRRRRRGRSGQPTKPGARAGSR